MPIYGLNDLKNSSGKFEYRKLELPINKNKKIWIPSMEFLYHRIHFNVKQFFPKATSDVVDCCNQNLGQNGKGCPICAIREAFWGEWKKTTDKQQKQLIQNKINKIVAEEIWFNCIDIEDPDKAFQAVRFTMPKGKDILNTVENRDDHDIAHIIWYYKKLKKEDDKNAKVEYSLQDIDSPELTKLAMELKESFKMLSSRSYEEGGLVDLENSIVRNRTAQSIKDIINGNGKFSDDEDVESNVSSKNQTSTVDIDENDSISLDDLDTKPEKEESIEMDGLDLEPLDEPPVKYIKITSEMYADKIKQKDVGYLKATVEFAIKEKLISDAGKLNDNVKAVYTYIKEKKDFQVPETIFK